MKIWKIIIIAFSIFVFSWISFSVYKIVTTTAPDFSVLWLIAKDFYKTPNPYLNPDIFTPSGYPPFTYLFYIPLTPLNFHTAELVFILISLAAIFGSVYLSLKIVFKKTDIYMFLFASSLVLASFPTKFTLGMGQINSVALFLLLYSLYQSIDKKGGYKISGIILGIAIILKPIFGFFLLFYIATKKWRVVFYSLITVFLAFITSLIYYGPNLWFYWLNEIVKPLMNLNGREVYYNQGFLGFISRLSPSITIRKISELASVIFLVPVLFLSGKVKNNILTLSALVITLLLIDSLSWQHHFVWLIFPFVVISKYAIQLKKLWFLILLAASYFLVSWNFKNPFIFMGFPENLIISNTFYGTVILYLLTLYLLRRSEKA